VGVVVEYIINVLCIIEKYRIKTVVDPSQLAG